VTGRVAVHTDAQTWSAGYCECCLRRLLRKLAALGGWLAFWQRRLSAAAGCAGLAGWLRRLVAPVYCAGQLRTLFAPAGWVAALVAWLAGLLIELDG